MESTKSSTRKFEPCFMNNFTEPTPEQIERERLEELAEQYEFYGLAEIMEFKQLREKYNRSRAHIKDNVIRPSLDCVPAYAQYFILRRADEVPNEYTREPFSVKVDTIIDYVIFTCRNLDCTYEENEELDDIEVLEKYLCREYILASVWSLIRERTEEE